MLIQKKKKKKYYVAIIERKHEIDSYLYPNKNNTFKNELKDLLLYPVIEGDIEIKSDEKNINRNKAKCKVVNDFSFKKEK